MGALGGFACGEGEGADGSAVKAAREGYEELFAGVPFGEFYGCFDGFGSAVAEVDFLFGAHRGEGGEFFGEVYDFGGSRSLCWSKQEPFALSFDGGDHFWVAVPHVNAGDAELRSMYSLPSTSRRRSLWRIPQRADNTACTRAKCIVRPS